MKLLTCSEIKDSMSKYMEDRLRVSTSDQSCTLTLPIKTFDGRWVSIFVEQKFDESFLVHDGGVTEADLFSQGVKMGDTDRETQAAIAGQYEVAIGDRIIQRVCRRGELSEAIMAVGQCAAMITVQLYWAPLEIEEDRVYKHVSEALKRWKPIDVDIAEKVVLEGTKEQHTVGFVATKTAHNTAAVDVLLSRGGRGIEKARKYDYTWLDMERKSHEYRNWARLAIVPSAEVWSARALEIIRNAANEAIELPSAQESTLDERISESMSKLTGPGFSPGDRAAFSLH